MDRNESFAPRRPRKRTPFALGALVALTLAGAGCGDGPRLELPETVRYGVQGTVRAADQPVYPASVMLSGTPVGSFTRADGSFEFKSVRPGSYRLTVVHLGLRSSPLRLSVPGPADTSATLALSPDPKLGPPLRELDEVDVAVTLSPNP